MGDLTWLSDGLALGAGIWEKAEPWVSGIANIAVLLGLLWGGWQFLRLKILPYTRFGLHTSTITAHLTRLREAMDVEDTVAGDPIKCAAFFARQLIALLGLVTCMCFVGLTVEDMSFRLPVMGLFLLGLLGQGGRVLSICEYLMNPLRVLRRTVNLLDSLAARAIATGIEDEKIKQLKARMEALKAKDAADSTKPKT